MATQKLRIPEYRHHKARKLAVVTIDGKDVYLGPYNSAESQERYHRLIAELIARRQHPSSPSPLEPSTSSPTKRMVVNELILAFWDHADRYYRHHDGTPTTELAEFRRTLALLRELYGRTYCDEFGPKALKAMRAWMIQTGWSRGVINQRIGRIKRTFKWGVENELIPPAIFQGLAAVGGLRRGRSDARETDPIRPVSASHVTTALQFLHRHLAAMVQVQLLSGMRPGEVCAMAVADLDTSGKVWVYTPGSHKTAHHGHARRIVIGPRAQAILRPFLQEVGSGFLFSPRKAMQEFQAQRRQLRKTRVQPSQFARGKKTQRRQAGLCYSPSSYAHAIRAACKKAGIPSWHPHQLRHTAGTTIRREFGLDMARVVLGHRSPQITEVYAEIDVERAAEVMERLG